MKKTALLLLVVMLILSFAGCGSSSPYISEEEAEAAVIEKAGGGQVEGLALGSVEGFKVYCGTVTNGADTFEFQVDAESGTVVNWIKNGENAAVAAAAEEPALENSAVTPSEGIALSEDQYIDSSAAQAIVSIRYPSAFIESVELLGEDGEYTYEIGITYEGESLTVRVDAASGEITE